MTDNSTTIRQLGKVQATIAHLTELLRQAEATRDVLINRLTDTEGAHDRRPVAVR
jgi:hypothetical protein